MAKILADVSGFSGADASANGLYTIHVTRLDVALAAASVGRWHWFAELSNDPLGFFVRALHVSLEACGYIRRTRDGWSMSASFEKLDQSDKAPITYRLGMAVTKLIYGRVLRVPRLLHIDALVASGRATLATGSNKRGDLAGCDAADRWHVVEAKGRSSARNDSLVAEAKKEQAGRVMTIDGSSPASKSASCVFTGASCILGVVRDPPSEGRGRMSLECSPSGFARAYYDPMLSILAQAPADRVMWRGIAYNVVTVFRSDLSHLRWRGPVRFGLSEEIISAYRAGDDEGLRAAASFERRFGEAMGSSEGEEMRVATSTDGAMLQVGSLRDMAVRVGTSS